MSEPGSEQQPPPDRLLFRTPAVAVLAALLLALCATPFAVGAPGFFLIYLVPLGIMLWVLRTRTTADAEGLTVRRLFTSRRLPWTSLTGLRLTKRAGVRAVPAEGREIPLPAVRTRHLSALSLISRGRLDDPLADQSLTS